MNVSNITGIDLSSDSDLSLLDEDTNPCPYHRAILRPILYVNNYSLFIFGAISNFLAFAILMQRALRCHSTFAYLAFLSLSNGLLSLVRVSQWMLKYYWNVPVETFSLLSCRFYRFSLDFLTHFSLFTLICVNIDRARTVTTSRPSTKFRKSTFHTVVLREIILASILFAFHFHWLIKFGHQVPDGNMTLTICNSEKNLTSSIYFYFLNTFYSPFDLIVFLCLPLLINIFCTIIIVRSLRVRMRTAKRFRPQTQSLLINPIQQRKKHLTRIITQLFPCFIPSSSTSPAVHSCFCCQIQCRRHTRVCLKIGGTKRSLIKYAEENECNDRRISSGQITNDGLTQPTATILNKQHKTRRTRDIHLSAMLIALNILYLLLNLPFNFNQTFAKILYKNMGDFCVITFIHTLLDTLQQTYFSTNFFLYVLTNRRFREEFCNTIMNLFHISKQQQRLSNPNIIQNDRHRSRTLSMNPSTVVGPVNPETQIGLITISNNPDSVVSEFETNDQLNIPINETNNKYIGKLVMFRDCRLMVNNDYSNLNRNMNYHGTVNDGNLIGNELL